MKIIPILNIHEFEPDISHSQFYCNDINEHLERNKNHFHKPHKHNFHLCVLFSQGSGIHEIDFNSYEIAPGSVFFLRPGQTHYWKFNTVPKGYIFFHTQDFYELYLSKSKLEQFPFYHTYENEPLLQLTSDEIGFSESRFKELYDEYKGNKPYRAQKIASLIHTAYIDLARKYLAKENIKKISSTTYSDTMRLLEKCIEDNFRTEKSVQYYADHLNITSKHLNRIVKATLGRTTTDIITDRVILESKRLIVHSGNSLSAVSEMLGYRDYAYFSRLFKMKTNTTPLEFKKGYK
ncbi:MAG: AraC family transcriptional regulator [Flavobacteriaceae bacterium]